MVGCFLLSGFAVFDYPLPELDESTQAIVAGMRLATCDPMCDPILRTWFVGPRYYIICHVQRAMKVERNRV